MMWQGNSPQGLGPDMLAAPQSAENPHFYAQQQAQAQISPANQLISPAAGAFTQMDGFPMGVGHEFPQPEPGVPQNPGNFMFSPMAGAPSVPAMHPQGVPPGIPPGVPAGVPPDVHPGMPQNAPSDYPQHKKRKADVPWPPAPSNFDSFSPPQDDEFGDFPTGDMGDGDGDMGGIGKRGMMKIPDAIDTIAKEEKSLRYNPKDQTYFVISGTKFEEDFNSLRATRNKKSDSAKDRPFSRMHKFYTLIQGEKWACTGSIFIAKTARTSSGDSGVPSAPECASALPQVASPSEDSLNRSTPLPHTSRGSSMAPAVNADNVTIELSDSNGDRLAISLQKFLDVTGAGELYKKAMSNTANQDFHFFDINQDGPLMKDDVYKIVGGVWSADSRGDQAYFFKREDGVLPMRNGAIVSLLNGKIVADQPHSTQGLYMVVSDNNAKWKGEPIPTPEEELEGHWCAFLGQVPVVVEGAVKTGDHIGPKCDGSGVGIVTEYGKGPVIGIALQDKTNTEPRVIKTLVFAGLNAFKGTQAQGCDDSQYDALLQHHLATEEKLEVIKDNVMAIETNVASIHTHLEGTKGDVATIDTRLALLEGQQYANVRAKELDLNEESRTPSARTATVQEGPEAAVTVPLGIPLNASQADQGNGEGTLIGAIRKHPVYFGTCLGMCFTLFVAVVLSAILVPALGGNDGDGDQKKPKGPKPPKPSGGGGPSPHDRRSWHRKFEVTRLPQQPEDSRLHSITRH